MEDIYFNHTPVYQLWCDLIELDALIFSTDLIEAGYRFNQFVCKQEHIYSRYNNSEKLIEIQITYNYSDKLVVITKTQTQTRHIIDEDILEIRELPGYKERFAKNELFGEIFNWKQKLRAKNIF